MSLQFSTTVRNDLLDAIEASIGTSAKIMFYAGGPPANCAASDGATKLGEIDLSSDWAADASNGTKSFNNTPLTTSAISAGLLGHFRIYASDGTTCHVQGLAGQTWTTSTAIVLNQQAANGGKIYRCTTPGTTASSGGPSGVGSSISDGSVVWEYVGTADMILDNSDVLSGQTISITSFTLTAPGA